MALRAVLFDLDGTLLPLDQDEFIQSYMKQLAVWMAQYGYEPKQLIRTVWAGSEAMVRNNGLSTNESIFWNIMAGVYGPNIRDNEPKFNNYYRESYPQLAQICGYDPEANRFVQKLKNAGIRLILATNPVFPAIATDQRIAWAGLDKSDFELVTTYENASFCKPNLRYYSTILEQMGLSAEQCLMVGNDVDDDMPAQELGMQVFLLTDHLVNRRSVPIDCYPHGGFVELNAYIDANL